jgi:hypothetical protein
MIIGCDEFGRLDRVVAALLRMPPLPPLFAISAIGRQAELGGDREIDAHQIVGKEVGVVGVAGLAIEAERPLAMDVVPVSAAISARIALRLPSNSMGVPTTSNVIYLDSRRLLLTWIPQCSAPMGARLLKEEYSVPGGIVVPLLC